MNNRFLKFENTFSNSPGCSIKSCTIVGTPVHCFGRSRSINCKASPASHLYIKINLAPEVKADKNK